MSESLYKRGTEAALDLLGVRFHGYKVCLLRRSHVPAFACIHHASSRFCNAYISTVQTSFRQECNRARKPCAAGDFSEVEGWRLVQPSRVARAFRRIVLVSALFVGFRRHVRKPPRSRSQLGRALHLAEVRLRALRKSSCSSSPLRNNRLEHCTAWGCVDRRRVLSMQARQIARKSPVKSEHASFLGVPSGLLYSGCLSLRCLVSKTVRVLWLIGLEAAASLPKPGSVCIASLRHAATAEISPS